jgi:ribonuclease HI
MENFLSSVPLTLHNTPSLPTFQSGPRSSFIDLTLSTANIATSITEWCIHPKDVLSDHRMIGFTIFTAQPAQLSPLPGYNFKAANWLQYNAFLHANLPAVPGELFLGPAEVDSCVCVVTDILQKATYDAIPHRKPMLRRAVPWWTEELTQLKRLSRAANRHYHNCKNPDFKPLLYQYYHEHCTAFKRAVKRAKRKSWQTYCSTSGNTHPWTTVYRILKRNGPQQSLRFSADSLDTDLEETINHTLTSLFPQDDPFSDTPFHRKQRSDVASFLSVPCGSESIAYFSSAEIKAAILRMQPLKAPGNDQVFSLMLQKSIGPLLPTLTHLFNSCLRLSYFPARWKTGKLILLRKPDLSIPPPKCYRPIILLSVLGKLFERLLLTRLDYFNITNQWISPSQFGFCPGKSTEQAIFKLVDFITTGFATHELTGAIFLDISGAFDNAWHPGVLSFLIQRDCPPWLIRILRSYLSDRQVTFQYSGFCFRRELTKSCPQGGILSPFIWNCAVNTVFDTPLDQSKELLNGYADDLVFCTRGKSPTQIQHRLTEALGQFIQWAGMNKLTFNLRKTKTMLFSRTHTSHPLSIVFDGVAIEHVTSFKYLGVHLDRKLLFTTHVDTVCAKASQLVFQLSRCARQTWGLSRTSVLTLYRGAILPFLLYGSPTWGYVSLKRHIQLKLQRILRLTAIRALRAYKTTSSAALELLCDLPPIDLEIQRRCLFFFHSTGLIHDKFRFLLSATGINLYPIQAQAPLLHPNLRAASRLFITFDHDITQLAYESSKALHLYSDGSKTAWHVGCASIIFRPDAVEPCTILRRRLASYCTVFQAELLGLSLGVEWVAARHIQGFTIKFFVDSQSLVAALNSFHIATSLRPLLLMLNELAANHKVSIHWIPAHQGHLGNEEADRNAKLAAQSDDVCEFLPLTRSGVAQIFQPYMIHAWQAMWDTSSVGRLLHDFCPCVPFPFASMVTHPTTVQFLTGHGNFRSYMHRFGHSTHSSCACGAGSEDSLHIIYDCPRYATQRAKLSLALTHHNFIWPLLPFALLSSKISFQLFQHFLSDLKRPLFF